MYCLSPLFNVVNKVINTLLRSPLMLQEVVRSGALPHPHHINGDEHEMVDEVLVQIEVQNASCCKAMHEYNDRLRLLHQRFCLVMTHHDRVNIDGFGLV